VDFGGTKIEAAALDADGRFVTRLRRPTPGRYDAALDAVAELIEAVAREAGPVDRVGVGMPGSPSPRTGLVRNANSTWLNGRRFGWDLEDRLGRPVRLANDANCMALSEASDGAAAGARVVFGVIVGTGCGGGVVVDGRLIEGANGIAGEWGHTPLPWPGPEDDLAEPCWCGRRGCLELYVSGTGFERDHARTNPALRGPEIVAAMRGGDAGASAAFRRYLDRLGRGLAVVCDLLDPEVIVLGGGMSNVDELYAGLPAVIRRHVFSDGWEGRVVRAQHGDSSGVRGAAWLWPLDRADAAPG
jgi:fructokinase